MAKPSLAGKESKRRMGKRSASIRLCLNCAKLRVEAKTREAVIDQREQAHREQQAEALNVILALMAEAKGMETMYSELEKAADSIASSAAAADKSLASYVQSFDAFKAQLRAILDRERDGRLAPADMQELRGLVR